MKSRTKGILRVLSIGALLLLVAGVGVWRFGTASGVGTTLSIAGAPASVSAGGSNFQVEIRVAAVSNLASYEWRIQYDPAVVELTEPPTSAVVNGSFLGGTGRGPVCELLLPPNVGLEPGEVRFGCATVGASPPGPSGAGLLSTVVFRVVASGSPNIQFVCAALADPLAEDIPIDNVPPCVSPVTPTATPPGPSPTPGGPTVTPGGPTATVGIPTATVTIPTATVTPTGPVATPTPLPPGMEAVDLAAGCNPVATTYPNATPIETIAGAVGPAGNLQALWEFGGGVWLGYSPAYPQASDLTAMDFLDVVFACVAGPGSFARPIV